MAYFNTYAAAEAFIADEALPSIAIEVFDIAWIAGSPSITYSVNTDYFLA